ncbi:hypothetical protein AAFF_G00302660 [Aldrovandia affinis]|uniref:Uncharacterized protein n=1 Tax=Aldrovandia affinis TaxID=143900 RepID=A0AAD7R8A7_9TELE|nr:hypothetical protein AAFF_G00302660 [Aldrovandia affinis]
MPNPHRQIHVHVRSVQKQHSARYCGLAVPRGGDVHHRSSGDHGRGVDDLLLVCLQPGDAPTASPPAPPASPLPSPLPSRSSVAWNRLIDRLLNVRRRNPIIFFVYRCVSSLRKTKVLDTRRSASPESGIG